MIVLPFDLLIEVAAFCAGSYDFRTFVNIASTCKDAHKQLKPVLDRPILVWTKARERETDSLLALDFLIENDLQDPEVWERFESKAAAWARIQYIVTTDTCLLEDMFCSTQFNDNMEDLFPNLVAVFQHRTEVPGTWQLSIRRLLSMNSASSVIHSADATFGTYAHWQHEKPSLHTKLEIRVLHPEAMVHYKARTLVPYGGAPIYDEIVVKMGCWFGRAGADSKTALSTELHGFCDLATYASPLSRDGSVTVVVKCYLSPGVTSQGFLREFRKWYSLQSSFPLIVLDMDYTAREHGIDLFWKTMAKFYSHRPWNGTTKRIRVLRMGETYTDCGASIYYEPDHDVLKVSLYDKTCQLPITDRTWMEPMSTYGRMMYYTVPVPASENLQPWTEPDNMVDTTDLPLQ